jgi:hypothetical protein
MYHARQTLLLNLQIVVPLGGRQRCRCRYTEHRHVYILECLELTRKLDTSVFDPTHYAVYSRFDFLPASDTAGTMITKGSVPYPSTPRKLRPRQ